MDAEMDLYVNSETPTVGVNHVARWEFGSEAWQREVKAKLRVMHFENRAASKSYRHDRRQLRIVTTAKVEMVPSGQGWAMGRCRWGIEKGAPQCFLAWWKEVLEEDWVRYLLPGRGDP